MSDPLFADSETYNRLENMSADELDALPFGVIRMESGGIVQNYNLFESELAGLNRDQVIGKDFFVQVAPCTNNFMVREKYTEMDSSLDETIPYVFTYKMTPTKVSLRLLGTKDATWYLLVEPEVKGA